VAPIGFSDNPTTLWPHGFTVHSQQLQQIAGWIQDAQCCIAFTGAGISTESGIPDFRSPGGVWARNQPVLFDDFMASGEARHEYWRQKSESHRDMADAAPNAGHGVLSRWESQGNLQGVITQNIDGLHQLAGNQRVLELHGTARQVACLKCDARYSADPFVAEFLQSSDVPTCPKCRGILKHATVSFGQALPEEVLQQAMRWSHQADVMLAMGSSLVVTPAAELPRLAKQSGGQLAIINHEQTGLDALADIVIHAAIGETLTAIDHLLQGE